MLSYLFKNKEKDSDDVRQRQTSSYSQYKAIKNSDIEKRKTDTKKILETHPDRTPIIVYRSPSSDRAVPDIDKIKYLIPQSFTFGNVQEVIRKRIHLKPEQAIFIFADNTLIPSNKRMAAVYEDCKAEDGFLYLEYSGENTFG